MQITDHCPPSLSCGHKRELQSLISGVRPSTELGGTAFADRVPPYRLTDFNVAISIISLFTLLTKMIMFIMKYWYPLIGLFMSFAMVGLYTTSVYGQAGPDRADPRYQSSSPWYLRLSCDVAEPYGAEMKCMMAKGTFAATVIMLYVLPSLESARGPPY